ncbi:transcription antitermination factor NusB [Exiguobacterium sp. SRB7LM]|uniref:transcription antitermination factor NusB n=1 Tax=Exiguobacterium sp. SRB7LM TaxID=2608401 RepID=UPI0018C40671|nr:transcription antitermination factor NusB [Exiguobacterium sp. SRB7LM]MBG0917295.1 transcription antitermination factor NusB [Exiguobacterium sp. SRB7LM]
MKRHEAREKAIQTLFQIEVSKLEVDEAIEFALDGAESDPFYEQLVTGTLEHIEDIDALLVENLKNWRLDRLGNVERTILRMATFELLYVETIPENVTINEAVELAKSFADEEAGKLVNGVLGNIIKED